MDLVMPPICVQCKMVGSYLCLSCAKDLKPFSFSICPVCDRPTTAGRTHAVCRSSLAPDGMITLFQYRPPVSDYIKHIKYRGVWDAVRETPILLDSYWPSWAPSLSMLIPIPMHPEKQDVRGFNQAELIAKKLGSFLNIPIQNHAVAKLYHTRPQAEKNRKQRKKMEQCFTVLQPNLIQNQVLGIVDDVATTGTTLRLATQALKQAGAREVWCITLAHGY